MRLILEVWQYVRWDWVNWFQSCTARRQQRPLSSLVLVMDFCLITVISHEHHDCLFNRLFILTTKKRLKRSIIGPLWGNPLVTVGFPSQRATDWWIFISISFVTKYNIHPLHYGQSSMNLQEAPHSLPIGQSLDFYFEFNECSMLCSMLFVCNCPSLCSCSVIIDCVIYEGPMH